VIHGGAGFGVHHNSRGSCSQRSAKPGASLGVDKILVRVDFSDCSFEALKYATGFADKFGAKILLLNAVIWAIYTRVMADSINGLQGRERRELF
jgi:hypothetical protein